jgi:hypothetical protein
VKKVDLADDVIAALRAARWTEVVAVWDDDHVSVHDYESAQRWHTGDGLAPRAAVLAGRTLPSREFVLYLLSHDRRTSRRQVSRSAPIATKP